MLHLETPTIFFSVFSSSPRHSTVSAAVFLFFLQFLLCFATLLLWLVSSAEVVLAVLALVRLILEVVLVVLLG